MDNRRWTDTSCKRTLKQGLLTLILAKKKKHLIVLVYILVLHVLRNIEHTGKSSFFHFLFWYSNEMLGLIHGSCKNMKQTRTIKNSKIAFFLLAFRECRIFSSFCRNSHVKWWLTAIERESFSGTESNCCSERRSCSLVSN